MNRLGTTITTIALGGTLLLGAGVTSAAAQPLTAVSATSAASSMQSAAIPPATPPPAADVAHRAALLRSLPTLSPGSSGSEVLALQIGLRHKIDARTLQGTGYFGPLTLAAVQRFQRANGLVVDGIVGPRTWNALLDHGPDTLFALESPQVRPGQIWPRNAQGIGTEYIQLGLSRLNGLTSWAPSFERVAPPRPYTGVEVEVVRELQRRAGIEPSGIVGPRTARAVLLIFAVVGGYRP